MVTCCYSLGITSPFTSSSFLTCLSLSLPSDTSFPVSLASALVHFTISLFVSSRFSLLQFLILFRFFLLHWDFLPLTMTRWLRRTPHAFPFCRLRALTACRSLCLNLSNSTCFLLQYTGLLLYTFSAWVSVWWIRVAMEPLSSPLAPPPASPPSQALLWNYL